MFRIRSRFAMVLPIGLLVGVAALAACSSPEEKSASTPTAAATQVAGAATAAATATTKAAGTELTAKWPSRNASIPLLGAIPNAPARLTPTPLPAGVTATAAPPRPTPPPAQKVQIAYYVDTTTTGAGESPYNVDANIGCVRTSVFARGMHVLWRVVAYDNTGTELQTDNVDSMVLKVGGKEATFRYGKHGDFWFWTATYDIPMDAPLGPLDWEVVTKTKSGLTQSYKEIAVWTAPGAERIVADGSKTISDSRTIVVN